MKQTLDILFENQDFLAVNKPSGLLTIPDRHNVELPSLYKILQKQYGQIFVVHRLDKETSGLLVFAKNESTHQFLSRLFEDRTMQKFYTGLVNGKVMQPRGRIEMPITDHPSIKGKMMTSKRGKAAITDFEVLADFGLYTWLQLQIHTGRTHQIRVHLQSIGHPIVMDELYGLARPVYLSQLKKNFKLSKDEENERPLLNRLALHAQKLIFTDAQGHTHCLEAPMPKDLQATLNQLRKNTR